MFLKGFCASVSLQCFAIVSLALYRKIYTGGLYLFTVPELRLWGADVFPDWPNYIAFFIIIAFLLNLTFFRKPVSAAVNLTAAFATTSRTPILGLMIFTLFSLKKNKARLIKAAIFICVALAVFIVFANFNQEFKNRILLFSDRNTIYKYGLGLIAESPLFGMGSVLFDKSIGHVGFASCLDPDTLA